jgi:hypothetical protein
VTQQGFRRQQQLVVSTQEQQPVAGGEKAHLVHGVVDAAVRLGAPPVDAVCMAPQDIECAVGGSAVDDDQFERGRLVPQDALQRPFQNGGGIESHHADAQARRRCSARQGE